MQKTNFFLWGCLLGYRGLGVATAAPRGPFTRRINMFDSLVLPRCSWGCQATRKGGEKKAMLSPQGKTFSHTRGVVIETTSCNESTAREEVPTTEAELRARALGTRRWVCCVSSCPMKPIGVCTHKKPAAWEPYEYCSIRWAGGEHRYVRSLIPARSLWAGVVWGCWRATVLSSLPTLLPRASLIFRFSWRGGDHKTGVSNAGHTLWLCLRARGVRAH